MAKIPFSKLQVAVNNTVTCVCHESKNGTVIEYEVKNYLPFKEKLTLISNIINQSIDDNNFYNPMRLKLYTVLEITYAYTNLTFTEKMKDDPFKLYDMLISSGIFKNILNIIKDGDWQDIQENITTVIDNIYKYQNSAMGIIDMIKTNYNDLNLDATAIHDKLADPDNLSLLKSIMTELG